MQKAKSRNLKKCTTLLFLSLSLLIGTAACDDTTSIIFGDMGNLTPENALMVTETRPEFTWDEVANGQGYEIRLSTDSDFSTEESAILTRNRYIPAEELSDNQTYYWQIRALSSTSSSDWSEVQSFTTRFGITISTAEELAAMEMEGTYRLSADVDLAETEWTPLGTRETPFEGIFIGNGYTISNLTLDTGTDEEMNLGLFGFLGTNAEIRNLKITDFSISGIGYLGLIAAENRGLIEDCTVEGTVHTEHQYTGIHYLGGIAAYNYGTIQGSTSEAVIHTEHQAAYAGGITGYNDGGTLTEVSMTGESVTHEWTSGQVGATVCGGLVGFNRFGTITDSTSIAVLTERLVAYDAKTGGLAGYNFGGRIENCTAEGDVSGGKHVGGLVGYNDGTVSPAIIRNCELTGTPTIEGYSYVGGLVGYSDTALIEDVTSAGIIFGYNGYTGGLIGYNEKGIINRATSSALIKGHDQNYYGGLIGMSVNGSEITDSRATGSIIDDLDIGSGLGGLIGNSQDTLITSCSATGTISITGSSNLGGLVGSTDEETVISDCYATGRLSGNAAVGGLVGSNGGDIIASYATGRAFGSTYSVGGLAGGNGGTIQQCYATGDAAGYGRIGGLVGTNSGIVENSFARGEVSGSSTTDERYAGLIGQNSGSITNCYATGLVERSNTFASKSDYEGGLIGENLEGGVITSAFYDRTTTEQSDTGKGSGLSTSVMKTASTFTDASWDFEGETDNGNDDIWQIDSSLTLNNGYPYLTGIVLAQN